MSKVKRSTEIMFFLTIPFENKMKNELVLLVTLIPGIIVE